MDIYWTSNTFQTHFKHIAQHIHLLLPTPCSRSISASDPCSIFTAAWTFIGHLYEMLAFLGHISWTFIVHAFIGHIYCSCVIVFIIFIVSCIHWMPCLIGAITWINQTKGEQSCWASLIKDIMSCAKIDVWLN